MTRSLVLRSIMLASRIHRNDLKRTTSLRLVALAAVLSVVPALAAHAVLR